MTQAGRRFAIVIPARFASHRFPGKPLAQLRGSTGVAKSLIQRTWECANGVDDRVGVWVATDDMRIAEAVEAFGGQVLMTSADCRNGTERCADAAAQLGCVADFIVNIQGDAPLTPAFIVPALIARLAEDADAAMVTPVVACSASLYRHLIADQSAGRVGGTTAVFDDTGRALYFSKRVIPHRPDTDEDAHRSVHLHLGVYAYRSAALAAYAALPPSPLETCEGLEQLRFLENRMPARVVRIESIDWDCIELNNPEDSAAIEAILSSREII